MIVEGAFERDKSLLIEIKIVRRAFEKVAGFRDD